MNSITVDYEAIKKYSSDDFLEVETYSILTELPAAQQAVYILELKKRAKEVGQKVNCDNMIDFMLKAISKEEKQKGDLYNEAAALIGLERGKTGPATTVENFLTIMRKDEYFSGLMLNDLSGTPEVVRNGKIEIWRDVDDSKARHYIEKTYKLSAPKKYDDAISVKFEEVKYHPVKEVIEAVEWDGIERIETLLIKWLKCDDNEYTREVSRLIFAGGINRIYHPGCKFDDVPILVGTRQGEGKSTFCRWLAIKDDFFREVSEIDGQKGIEAIEGGWICEMSELLALTKAKEVEAVKAYVTRQVDSYRKPYERRTGKYKRQCIFIGTTNKAQFLTDKTGNRRFYPVEVNQYGYELFKHEDEVRADIVQCWAEAKVRLDKGEMKPFADAKLIEYVKEAQKSATEEDWREELIIDYLSSRDEVCVRELWHDALEMPEYSKPTKKESNEIGLILQATKEWKRAKGTKRFSKYGPSKYWVRVKNIIPPLPEGETKGRNHTENQRNQDEKSSDEILGF